jgi:hypothetical protein
MRPLKAGPERRPSSGSARTDRDDRGRAARKRSGNDAAKWGLTGDMAYDWIVSREREREPRPGLVKTRNAALFARRKLELVKASDYRFRELFENADVMSEGKTRDDTDGATYYGSTSILLPFTSKGGGVPDDHADEFVALIRSDPHARIRAVRVACVEAQVRAHAVLGRVRAELFVRRDRKGVRVDVEVEARVLREQTEKRGDVAATSQRGRSTRA